MKIKGKNRYKNYFLAAASVMLIAAVVINLSLSYLVSNKQRDNVFSLGNVKLTLTEEHFPEQEERKIMAPNSIIPKDPRIINSGNSDEYVFLKIVVPLCDVKMVNDDNKGVSETGYREIFNFGSDAADKQTMGSQGFTIADTGTFEYAKEWILVSSEENLSAHTHSYLFGYSSMLIGDKDQSTTTLFDKIQMRNILEGELPIDAAQTIAVYAYGIQSEEILNQVNINNPSAVTEEELAAIFALYEKAGGTV